jgi:hypothetical protein
MNTMTKTAIGVVVMSLALTGCDLTRVADPTIVTPPAAQTPAGAASARVGALSALFGAFSEQSLFTGLFVDEFTVVNSSAAGSFPEDQRTLSPLNAGLFPFADLSGGRINAIIAAKNLETYSPQPVWQIGELYALAAAAELEFAEDLCSGVPLATIAGFTPSYGPTLSRQQLMVRVLTDLDSAAAHSTGSDSIANLVAVLRGRAYADNGNLTAASAAVQTVPLTFAYAAELSDTTDINVIYKYTVLNPLITVSDVEGTNGLPFVSAADPRVPTVAVANSNTGSNTYSIAGASNGSSPLTMASGIEAQLLIAEAQLAAGQIAPWTGTLNSLRENAISPAMADLTSDSTTTASPAMQLAVMFRERAFWLFATGHREGDIRRLVRQYGLPVNSVYPVGPYLGGPATYGNSVVYPVGGELDDPTYHGCLNTNP